jgi:hypothetical protein
MNQTKHPSRFQPGVTAGRVMQQLSLHLIASTYFQDANRLSIGFVGRTHKLTTLEKRIKLQRVLQEALDLLEEND